GVDSHGIGMLPRYHELWQAEYIRMDAEPSIVRDEVATALLDGQKGLGHYVSTLAMKACIEKARTFGLGMVAVRNSGHYGAAANYSMMALEHDLIGLSMTNSPYVAMVPTFGRKAMLSTNPISFAAPARTDGPPRSGATGRRRRSGWASSRWRRGETSRYRRAGRSTTAARRPPIRSSR